MVTSLTQHAGQFEFFPGDDGEPLKQESDTITLSSKVNSQVAMNRLEGMEVTRDLGFGSLRGESLSHGAVPKFLTGNFLISFAHSKFWVGRSGLDFYLTNLGEVSLVHQASE